MRGKIARNAMLLAAMLVGVAAFLLAGKEIKRRWIVYNTLHSRHWRERVAEIEALKPGKFKTIFLGNSLTELFWLDQYFSDSTILNCGIVGDFTEGLVKRANSIIRLKPEKLFIEIGINDMVEQISLKEINCHYEQLIRKIKEGSPGTSIYIQSNLPLIIRHSGFLADDRSVNDEVVKQNANLAALARKYNLTYIDLYHPFLRSGRLSELVVEDGVHLTHKAYTVWKLTVLPYLCR